MKHQTRAARLDSIAKGLGRDHASNLETISAMLDNLATDLQMTMHVVKHIIKEKERKTRR